jgi:outer membrane receptor protein involved in Fe transport
MAQQSPPAPAQPTPPAATDAAGPQSAPDTSAASPSSPEQVEDIIVTAQRRSENLQRVPIAITALSSNRLTTAGVTTTAALPSIVPSLSLGNSVGFIQPRIRGVGNSSAGAGIENSVAIYVDGVYISSSPGSLLSLNNIERVEVLKGPQGTLFGRNATGGLIQIITKDPGQTFNGSADISYGNYDTIRGEDYIGGPISSNLAADLAVSIGHQGDGYGKNLTTGQDIYRTAHDVDMRSKLVWDLGPTKIHASFDYSDILNNDPQPKEIAGTFSSFYPTTLSYPSPWDARLNGNIFRHIKTGGVSLKVEHDFGGVTLSSISAYRRTEVQNAFDADGTPSPAIFRTYISRDNQYSQEFQLSSPSSGRFQWVAGAYLYYLTSGYVPGQVFTDVHGAPLPSQILTTDVDSTTTSFAGYAQATYEILPRTHLTAGFRYTYEKRELTGTLGTFGPGNAAVVTSLPHKEVTFDTPTWRISLDHEFNSNVMGYLSYNRGFKSGGYNGQAPTSPAYQPEYLDAYEGGLKTTLFDRTLRLNVSGFYYNYRDIQVNTFVGATPIIYNGARAEMYGLDGDFDWVVNDHVSFNGGVTLLHDRFTSFPNAVVTVVQPGGHTTTVEGSATGNRLPFAPDAVFNLGVDLKGEVSDTPVELSVQNQYNTGYYGQPDNYLKQGAYDLLSATLSVKPRGTPLTISAYGSNLLNKAVAVFLSSGTTGQTIAYGAPRTYGMRLAVKF